MKYRKTIIGLVIIALFILGYFYTLSLDGDIKPVGRIGFVKFADPDMYPGNPHSVDVARYAQERNSKCALVVHFGGSSKYSNYTEGNVTILQLAFLSPKGATTDIDWREVLQFAVFGVPDGKWRFRANGKEFDTLDEALDYIQVIAEKNGQKGPIPMFWHGTARGGNTLISQGCGFQLYYYICWKKYGQIAAYYYFLQGAVFPFFNLPTWQYELEHASELQKKYTGGELDMFPKK